MARQDHLNHTPDKAGIATLEEIRRRLISLEEYLEQVVPPSRELSIAKTKLEEVRMWAVKGVVMQYPAQEV